MIYRYDQPVDMPIPELYDTGIMNAYLNAVKDQYESGEKRMDEYLSKYSDFTSPFQQDVKDYDRLVYGRMNNLLDDLQKRGIDPLRSAEGRAAVARLIRTTPVGDIAQLRQSSKIGQQYLAAIQDARRRGEYDQQFEDFLLQQSGLPSFNDFSTLKNGQWERTAPGIYKTLGNATNDWYDEIKPTDKGSKNGYLWRGIDMNDLINIAKPRAQAFSNTDLGKYYKHLIEEDYRNKYPNATEQEIKEAVGKQFISDIAQSHHEKLIMLPETDPYAMLAEKDKYDRAAEARKFEYSMKLARAKGELKDNSNNSYPASYTTMNNTSTINKQNQNILNFTNQLVQYKKKYYQNILKNTKNKNSKQYKDAQVYLNYWNTVEKHPFNPGKGLQPLFAKGQFGETIPSKFLRGKYEEYIKNNVIHGGSDATAKYINSYTYELRGDMATPIKNAMSTNVEVVPGSNLKCRTVDYGNGNFTYSATKVKGMYGRSGTKVQRAFNKWLTSNHIKAYMTGGTVRQDRQPGRNTTGVNTYYFDTYITDNQMKNFMDYCKTHGIKLENNNGILKHLGITEERTNRVGKGESGVSIHNDYKGDTNYRHVYKFSTAFTDTDNLAGANADIEYDKARYGASNAYNLAEIRQQANAANMLNLH